MAWKGSFNDHRPPPKPVTACVVVQLIRSDASAPCCLEPGELGELHPGDVALGALRPAAPDDECETDAQGESVDETSAPEGGAGGAARSRKNCVHDGDFLHNGVRV